ncbi:uncharacterized protein LOC102721225 isoform X1 [Oryza brachyantha]|uniref:uncharacterized protein LOC102721225 isoform X1 n=1 Tax=Oryza brachyantha TaxID=4533 RepID=UPI001AD96606|nr:uncharacterized protein LOC102721225 isoform X1 [Oryza brachyantha]
MVVVAGTGRVVALGVVVAVVVLLGAGGADADCFDYCFKDCISRDRSMIDYCNYACDKTCSPDRPLASSSSSPPRPLAAAAGDMGCQLSCAWDSCHRLRPAGKSEHTARPQRSASGSATTAAGPRPRRPCCRGLSALAPPACMPRPGRPSRRTWPFSLPLMTWTTTCSLRSLTMWTTCSLLPPMIWTATTSSLLVQMTWTITRDVHLTTTNGARLPATRR